MEELLSLSIIAVLVYWLIRRRRTAGNAQSRPDQPATPAQRASRKRSSTDDSARLDPDAAARREVIERHFELNQAIEMAKAAGDLDRVLSTARQSIAQLPEFATAWSEQRRRERGHADGAAPEPEWESLTVPALVAIHQIAPARGERELIVWTREVVRQIPGMEDQLDQLRRDLEDVEACEAVLAHLADNPGVKQAGMARGLGLDGHRVRSLLHWLERGHDIVRVPSGKTHRLYLPRDAPDSGVDEAPSGATGLTTALRSVSVELAAVDVETASGDRDSACAIAVAVVSRGRIVETRRWYVRPPDNAYRASNVRIHGIQPHRTADAPPFPEVWPEVQDLIGGLDVLAHNAAFDGSVIRRSLAQHRAHDAAAPTLFCTCQLSRRLWPDLDNHTLPVVAAHCGVPVEDHHDPVADAVAAAGIGVAICATLNVSSIRKAHEIVAGRAS